jgi:hypothetical protein
MDQPQPFLTILPNFDTRLVDFTFIVYINIPARKGFMLEVVSQNIVQGKMYPQLGPFQPIHWTTLTLDITTGNIVVPHLGHSKLCPIFYFLKLDLKWRGSQAKGRSVAQGFYVIMLNSRDIGRDIAWF